ncbi:iron-siderophore ABC transporter substrate-binding protein [Agromyces mediolanus]|uniref:ABC transporter substrate-binding protein n=1 Tax=Agromyces mediolanus TaxID=41986 RepID=UPI00203E2791|nr:iron-siderophore ABC transporter substrate-binding protein [Agromyces mediolanus]MCM3656281.1 iron-siderophore ABC transporter substrate-binding protein [Agromyces mediolanus]
MRSPLPRRVLARSIAVAVGTIMALAGCAPAAQSEDAPNGSASGTQPIEHARGTTEVPAAPQRVVALEPVELDTAVALGITPVGAAVASNVAGVPDYLGVTGVQPVGTVPEPDLEAIAALKPDLILGTEARHSKLYEQLSAIAPTVFMQTQADPWQENVLLIGAALGQPEEAKALLDGFNERCDRIAEEFDVEGKTVNLIRPRDETTLSLYGPTSFAGSALECAGLTIPAREWEDGLQADLSPENVLDATADYVLVTSADPSDDATIPPAIAQNRSAFPSLTLVDTSYWVSGVGPKGGDLVLDEIEALLETER